MAAWCWRCSGSVRRGFAVLLGAMGVVILSGGDKWVEARVLQWLPDSWVNLTIGL